VARERALLAAAAAVALAAAVVGIALAMVRHEGSSSDGSLPSSKASSEQTAPGRDPDKIIPGRSIGAVELGMSEREVKERYGPGIEGQWRSRGRAGARITYSGDVGGLTVSFYDGKVVQVTTSSSYYTTDDGVRVGVRAPSFNTLAEVKAALRKGAMVEIEPGVYTWKNFAVEPNFRLCLRDENAATQLTPRAGPSDRVGGVWITDARFLVYLPAKIVVGAPGKPPAEIFCLARPLEP
jgi:hypothetical protein